METSISQMSLAELAERCTSEINKYSQRELRDDQYCLEIFRRAMLQNDRLAWELLMYCYNGMVVGWMRRHPVRELAYRLDSEENYVASAFERFRKVTVGNSSLEFNTLASALNFLRACLNSAIIDTLRSYSRSNELPLPEPGFPEESVVDDSADEERSETWEIIKSVLPNEREQRVAYLLYQCGLKPREFVQFLPQEFDDVRNIYRLIRNIRDRLERNKDRLRWLLGGEALTDTYALAYANILDSKVQLPRPLGDFELKQTNALAHADASGSDEKKELPLFALMRTTLEASDKALIGKTYSVQAGISQNKPTMFTGEPFTLSVRNLTDRLPFDLLLHTSENIESISAWQKTLLYDPRNLNPQFVEFKFKVIAPGPGSLALNFYHERRWLKTIRLAFDTIEQSQLTSVTSEE